jgi:hypothetical protein
MLDVLGAQARQLSLQLTGLHASETLVQQIDSAATSLENQFRSVQSLVQAKCNDHSAYSRHLKAPNI